MKNILNCSEHLPAAVIGAMNFLIDVGMVLMFLTLFTMARLKSEESGRKTEKQRGKPLTKGAQSTFYEKE